MKQQITIGNLYAGVEGIGSGFEQAGAKAVWANEIDPNACKTIKENFKHQVHECGIETLNPNDLEKVNIITAGFPCQSFSIAGYRKGFEDETRGNHFFEVIRFVKALRPEVVFLENVKNLISHDEGKTFKIILDTIKATGYNCKHKILNSCDYGNVPQNRERIYIVCVRKDLDIDKFEFPEKIELTKSIVDCLESGTLSEKFFYREGGYKFKELTEAMTNYNTCYQWRRVYVRENKSGVCPTLTANMGTGGHNVPLIRVADGIRKLTPRECFNLQGFSESFVLPVGMANSKLYKQAGNSVTVPVIKRIAEKILDSIF